MNEFEIIKKFFDRQKNRADVIYGIGDDAAIVKCDKDNELVITTDTLVAGVHFPEKTSAFDIGFKSLAVNLSDLAAMGATPSWVTLALTLPAANKKWLTEFSRGFLQLAREYSIQLIGGDLTHGPLSITVAAYGFVPKRLALRRDQAKPGDLIYVTNTLGDAGLALKFLQNKISVTKSFRSAILKKLNQPQPRVAMGIKLRKIANAAIDISDGLAADLGHILENSQVGAEINIDRLPLSPMMRKTVSPNQAIALALGAGDDYELCFTVPIRKQKTLEKIFAAENVTCIGRITKKCGLKLVDEGRKKYLPQLTGYKHF